MLHHKLAAMRNGGCSCKCRCCSSTCPLLKIFSALIQVKTLLFVFVFFNSARSTVLISTSELLLQFVRLTPNANWIYSQTILRFIYDFYLFKKQSLLMPPIEQWLGSLSWLPTECLTAARELWLLMTLHKRHALSLTLGRTWLHIVHKNGHLFNVAGGDFGNENSLKNVDVMKMSVVAWFIPWMGYTFMKEIGEINKLKNTINIHVNWWVWQSWLEAQSHGTKTHRAWVAKASNLIGPL